MWLIAATAFGAIFFLGVPFPAIIAGAAVIGFLGGKFSPENFPANIGHSATESKTVIDDAHASPSHTRPSWSRAGKVLGIGLVLWWGPVLLAGWTRGWDDVLAQEGLFFSQAAMVTFGGAYAVLPYVSQQAVENYHWLTGPQMLDGLGLAETTPGPLIMVLQFVGFLGGWNHPGNLSPLVAATLGAAITTWTTFVPCFLWIFLGAPYIERLRGNLRFGSTLTAITASVVGVVLNLAVWFGLQVFFPPRGGVEWFAVSLAIVAFGAMERFKWGVIPIVLASGGAGWIWWVLKS
jgi:chromate transporter